MKFWEAIKSLEEGKRVRGKCWDVGAYWSFKSSGSMWSTISDIFVLSTIEWELYEVPEGTFTFSEMVKGLREGRKFRCKEWSSKFYIHCSSGVDLEWVDDKHSHRWHALTIKDLECIDWVEVT